MQVNGTDCFFSNLYMLISFLPDWESLFCLWFQDTPQLILMHDPEIHSQQKYGCQDPSHRTCHTDSKEGRRKATGWSGWEMEGYPHRSRVWEDGIGGFQRGNWERGYHLKCKSNQIKRISQKCPQSTFPAPWYLAAVFETGSQFVTQSGQEVTM